MRLFYLLLFLFFWHTPIQCWLNLRRMHCSETRTRLRSFGMHRAPLAKHADDLSKQRLRIKPEVRGVTASEWPAAHQSLIDAMSLTKSSVQGLKPVAIDEAINFLDQLLAGSLSN